MSKVSIIMPVYNSEKYIKETIQSILKQRFKDWNLIIVDDCSEDNSLKVINEFKNDKITILKNERRLGAALSRNKAIKQATGKYIAFIDSDDIWKENKLEKQIKFMEENQLGFSFTSYERINEKGLIIGEVQAPIEVDYNCILKNTPIQISTVVLDTYKIKKELIQFKNLKTCEDIELYLKILKTGVIAKGIKEKLVEYKVRRRSLSSNKVLNTIRRWNLYKQYNICFKDRLINILEHINNAIKRTVPSEKIKRLKEILRIITLYQIIDVLLFPIIWCISILVKPFCRNIWIIEENPNEACDNGYTLFKYIRENRKDINAYYIINIKSKDYKKVKALGNIIQHRSLKHWIYYLNAQKIVVTQKYANPSPALFHILHKKEIIKLPRIFLGHGITKDNCKVFYYNNTKFRLFICGAKKEFEYVKEKFGYPSENVVYTGLARFDNLDLKQNTNNKLILITPTWRKWISTQKDMDRFMKHYYDLLNNEHLIKCLEENDMKIIVVLHKNMKAFKVSKKVITNRITIYQNEEINIQRLINKAELLLTDYSSIFMDIAYRRRPIIFFQFDKEEFRQKHMQEGYFSYENDGFGDVLEKAYLVVNKIQNYIENNFKIEDKYSERIEKFFERKDKNNSKRILQEIEKI